MAEPLKLYNCESAKLTDLPIVSISEFRDFVINRCRSGLRIASLFATANRQSATGNLHIAVLADDAAGSLELISTQVSDSYPSLTPQCPQAHWFEREIAEQYGIIPQDHPWLKPIRFEQHQGRHQNDIGITDFFQVAGPEIHEVAVGPVHAGIIEPGHFRFQCNGENVLHLEISLGYQHRGIERAILGGPNKRSIHYMETAAGDTTIGHAAAYCQILETLSGCRIPVRAEVLRGIALELERLANHTGDLGALAGDVGYLPTASFCGRIRGDFLNMTAVLCGNRFGRGIIRPGGTAIDITAENVADLQKRLKAAFSDVSNAANCLWTTSSVLDRFEETGALSREMCVQLGIVGLPARACGIDRDDRYNFASGIFQFAQMPVSTWHTGDVFARAWVRWLEIQHSVEFIRDQLDSLPAGEVMTETAAEFAPDSIAVSLVEGWRGEICHVAITDSSGALARYKIVDPSFHNWMALAMVMRGQQISDFPLCNKSFNLSYCGHDL